MKLKLPLLFIMASALMIHSCRKELKTSEIPTNENVVTLNTHKKAVAQTVKDRFQLITIINMDIFETNPTLKAQALTAIHAKRKAGKDESLVMKDIINNDPKLPVGFASAYLSAFAQRIETGKFMLVEKVQAELEKVRKEGKKKQSATGISQQNVDAWDMNYILMAHLGAYIHFPYSELYEHQLNPEVYYTYDPLIPNATSTTVFWEEGNVGYTDMAPGSEEWAMQHASFVYLLDDEIAGYHLDNYLASACAQGDFLQPLCDGELIDIDNGRLVTDSAPPPPPNTTYEGPLENNIPPFAHATITNDKYLLSATIPRIRIKDNVRPGGFWNGTNRLYLYRGRAKIVAPNALSFSDAVRADSTSMSLLSGEKPFEISRYNGRKGNWVNVGSTFTEQWGQEQENNYLVVTYIAHWLYFDGADIDFKVNAGVYYDTTRVPITVTDPTTGITVTTYRAKGWMPKFEASAAVNGKIKLLGNEKRQKKLGEIHLTRASFMSQAIGNPFGLGTCSITGYSTCERQWAVRSIGSNFEYFLRVNIVY